ncbi:hypothetical protein G7Z17_g5343 [Cylindrodendrum hubeiense]|uniref:DEAD/DEAH box helicase n=1 Tax=Cylindrodendrum hubeiense TaxID=595255 RepID=A0A9P5H6X2_9HYPO|nr:hypothetical protein G7Z17_g5343 [Cylindrodendrum hubeiense]
MSSEEILLDWHSAQRTLNIDIVGDFAGGELFAIHGESLIKHCLEQSRVDFNGGFQLLHAIYAVEKFLNDLQQRGCNFDIVFFRDLDGVCVPEGETAADAYKYHLTRAVLIQHLARSDTRAGIHEFDSFESEACNEYLSTHSLHFILCHEGDKHEGSKTIQLRHLIWKFANSGMQVAIINSITWQTSKALVERGLDDCGMVWDLFDIIDGRIFSSMIEKVKANSPVPEEIMETARGLWKEVTRIQPICSDPEFDIALRPSIPSLSPTELTGNPPAILAFGHIAFNKFVGNIKANKAQETIDPAAGIVFEDLRHWHNNKPVISWKNSSQPGFFARRRKQEQMSEIMTYAASLQNASGKILDQETIIVGSRHVQRLASKVEKLSVKDTQKKGGKKPTKKSGKQSALKTAQEIQDRKTRAKRDDVIRFWAEKCAEFQTDPNMVSRYLKADKFLSSRSQKDHGYLSPEITTSATCTPEIADAVQNITTSLRMPHIDVTIGEPSRELSFPIDIHAVKHASKLVRDYRILQLEHGGPYMERRFDSKADPRVPFEPDAWQRKVLDSIDADENLLVIAPTSAGKTFISFYAMKKVLEESDDAVLVYVAPTKALVNQIAAEIEARFSKSYDKKAGKSVWAIHTRDYRINNPSGCQILVTVPHILQIMLLAPTNANQKNAWSRRVRRIIFDEVHCIGQAEDGVVWEQLLLLAPCPIIALSATVGNPNEFRDWLKVSRAKQGAEMTMVVHEVRYSDLRKFIYQPPVGRFFFNELLKAPRLPVPGLDEGNAISPNFKFVHPVVALKDRNRGSLDDVTLEARDCLTLWEKMKEALPPDQRSKVDALDPTKTLPQVISKSDIVVWEKGLKVALRKIMEASGSSLKKLQASLDPTLQSKWAPMSTKTEKKKNEKTNKLQIQLQSDHVLSLFPLVCELHSQDALPALAFSYDRLECERAVTYINGKLGRREQTWKSSDADWLKKIQEFKQWKRQMTGQREPNPAVRSKDLAGDASKVSKLDLAREEGSVETSPWESFDMNAPLEQFSFADNTKMQKAEFTEMIRTLRREKVKPLLIEALERGLGVHHAGMNRRYRQVVEMLFRRGYLRVVVATGTLALGINMPCKTVIFTGDSIFLTAQNYRQASGRAGRRGFDLLGNVVFNGIPQDRVYEIMASRLPDLRGQFPISTTLILRLFGLLHGTNNSEFAMDAVNALLSQTRLYLGGPDAEMSVKHHVRFSIEYLRRQNLISAEGTPLNFAGLVGHLYFTENSVFAFHSLLRGGYFHQLCADIDIAPERVHLEMMLVLCHLFNRIPVRRTKDFSDRVHRSPSIVFLPRLPQEAETMLIHHNQETLSIFKDCVHSYINQHLIDQPDRTMPFTRTVVGPSEAAQGAFLGCARTTIRSPFVSLSGFGDDFDTVQDLCSTVRGGVFLEESAIPYIRIWPHDTETELNAYILDFYKHGSMDDLVRDNRIKGGDVWFFLKDFSLTLKAIVSSLTSYVGLEANLDDEGEGSDERESEDLGGPVTDNPEAPEPMAPKETTTDSSKKKKPKVLDSWEDGSSDSESDAASEATDTRGSAPQPPLSQRAHGDGLMNVLKAFKTLQEDFEIKFKKVWA